MKNQRLLGILIAVAILLLIPFIAMQFSVNVNWSGFDFAVVAFLLLSTGLAIEFVLRRVRKRRSRILICLVILAAFLLVWAELAVGIFGTPFAGT